MKMAAAVFEECATAIFVHSNLIMETREQLSHLSSKIYGKF